MKILISILSLSLVLFSCKQVEKQSFDKETDWYKNKITELEIQYFKVFEYEYRFGELDEETEFMIELIEFDRKGNGIRKESYNRSEYLKEYNKVELRSYDTEGNRIETIEKDNIGEIKSIRKNKYVDGLNTERFIYNGNGKLKRKVVYKYDKSENLTEYVSYNESGNIEGKSTFKYNSKNEQIEEKNYNKDGNLESLKKLVEKADGQKEYQYFDENDELEYKLIYLTNERNQVIENIWVNVKMNDSIKTINKFDDNDFIVEIIKYENCGEIQTIKKTELIKFQN